MTKATELLAYLAVLEAKVDNTGKLYDILNTAAHQVSLDDKSDHTYYGINDDVIATLKIAFDLLTLAQNKLETVVGVH